jgi:glucose-6-phosphate isomerase
LGTVTEAADIWAEVERAASEAEARSIAGLFDKAGRAEAFSLRFDGMLLDYSKTALDEAARDALLRLAGAAGVAERRAAMFDGQPINETEGRAVLHTALRNLSGGSLMVGDEDIMPGIHATRARMAEFAEESRLGPITDVINIGSGGSHRGPEMAVRALKP